MEHFDGRVAVITGAASGLGRALADAAARRGMKLALADVDEGGLAAAAAELAAGGAEVLAVPTDTADGGAVEALATRTLAAFGGAHLVFNNAGVGTGGLIWESSANDWAWVFGVNVLGVAHGVRVFTPILLRQGGEGHIVNTASVAGLVSPPMMGVYDASKHAVVAMTEALHHDLALVSATIGCSVLCPAFVPTRIDHAERSRPAALRNETPETRSQQAAREQLAKAVASGKLSADEVAEHAFSAVRAGTFYILPHPGILPSVELRMRDILAARAPSDPFSLKPATAPRPA